MSIGFTEILPAPPPTETHGRQATSLPAEFESADPEEVSSAALEQGWEKRGFRGRVAELLRERGLRSRAVRFANCNRLGRPGVCSRYPDEHKYFVRHSCCVTFCKQCASEERRRLSNKYSSVVREVLSRMPKIPRGLVLAKITFTLRSEVGPITPTIVKKFNCAVRLVLKRTAQAASDDHPYGAIFIDEVGTGPIQDRSEGGGTHLHCHGLYLGPRLDWSATRDLWTSTTEKMFGIASYGFYITEVYWFKNEPTRALCHALNRMLKYVMKPPAVSAERLADLISAFHGTRRVHALGLFYGVKTEQKRGDVSCPQCSVLGIPSVLSFEGRSLSNGGCVPRLVPISELEADGYRDLKSIRREAFFSRADSSP